jgi:hypothetical protein
VLSERPFAEVNGIMGKIDGQAKSQLNVQPKVEGNEK